MTRDRRSPTELEAAVPDLEAETDTGVREVGFLTVLSTRAHSGPFNEVDADHRLYRLNGERVRLHESTVEVLASAGRGSA